MKILHFVGARPNFMKAAPVIQALSRRNGFSQVVVHTGQHYDLSMLEIFFQKLGLPRAEWKEGQFPPCGTERRS
jgi:UDP-N-acetylglucosamine 2-epimerase (non-hydrolysing)